MEENVNVFEAIHRLARRQLGLVTYQQLRSVGIPSTTVDRWARGSRLLQRSDSVFALPGTPDDWRVDALTGVLSAGPLAHLAHRAAATLWSGGDLPGRSVEVVVPKGRHRPVGPWTVHETRHLTAPDIALLGAIPVTSIERTLIDVGRYWPAVRVGRLLDEAVRRRQTTDEGFAERVAALRRRGFPGISVARAVLADREILEGSPFEQQMRRLLAGSGLPAPRREHPVTVGDRTYFVDFAFPEARLGIECDSTTWHTLPYQMDRHLHRQNDILGTGLLLLRYTPRRLREEPDAVLAEIEQRYRERLTTHSGEP